jgi:hypothetical protein
MMKLGSRLPSSRPAAEAPKASEPALAGYLSKGKRQSTRHFGFGGGVQLTKRWFKVTKIKDAGRSGAGALALSYYKNERSYEARGWLLLREATRIMGVTPTCFVVEHPKRSYILYAQTGPDLKRWVDGLTAMCRMAKAADGAIVREKKTVPQASGQRDFRTSHPHDSGPAARRPRSPSPAPGPRAPAPARSPRAGSSRSRTPPRRRRSPSPRSSRENRSPRSGNRAAKLEASDEDDDDNDAPVPRYRSPGKARPPSPSARPRRRIPSTAGRKAASDDDDDGESARPTYASPSNRRGSSAGGADADFGALARELDGILSPEEKAAAPATGRKRAPPAGICAANARKDASSSPQTPRREALGDRPNGSRLRSLSPPRDAPPPERAITSPAAVKRTLAPPKIVNGVVIVAPSSTNRSLLDAAAAPPPAADEKADAAEPPDGKTDADAKVEAASPPEPAPTPAKKKLVIVQARTPDAAAAAAAPAFAAPAAADAKADAKADAPATAAPAAAELAKPDWDSDDDHIFAALTVPKKNKDTAAPKVRPPRARKW